MKPLLVGESNPYSRDPGDALLPYPDRSAGHRLCTVILGMRCAAYLRSFDRCNLVQGDKWSVPKARAEAARIREATNPGITVVLLGSKVCAAFGIPYEVYRVFGRYRVLPHPSGLCRAWNEPGAFDHARDLVFPLLGPAQCSALGCRKAVSDPGEIACEEHRDQDADEWRP